MTKNKQTDNNRFEIVAGLVITILVFVAMIGFAMYWLVKEATEGNQAATMILTFLLIVSVIILVVFVVLALILGISKIQQSAARSNMELMKVNAIENQQIMNEVQKGLLLQAQTNRQQNHADIGNVRLIEMLTQHYPQLQSRTQNNMGSNIIDNAFGELPDE